VKTKTFKHKACDIEWYCELRGSGPTIVLIPYGESDCGSFARLAKLLADEFTVLTFDMPGFSRSSTPPDFDKVTVRVLADQIAGLVTSLNLTPATFYGCSSGGQNALATDRPTFAQIRQGVACKVGQHSGWFRWQNWFIII
jgi:pimeloyl-ACP methyl ester carboxylesterase